jgi:hypothetical protein
MSNYKSAAWVKADAEFRDVQSEARQREKVEKKGNAETQAQEDNTVRLKALRLARDAERNE